MWNNTTGVWPEIPLYGRLVNTFFYLILLPVAIVGNILAIAVVSYITKHRRTRRFIPDLGLGALAAVDLFSVVCVHLLTVMAIWWSQTTLSSAACVFQAFSASVYLKLQFLVQVAISLDRYVALVRPLKYHSVSSVKTMKIILSLILLISVGTTALTMVFAAGDIGPLQTWQFCVHEWQVESATDYALVGVIGFVFLMGFIAFIGSNVSLVCILRRYHARRARTVLKEISNAVGVMDKGRRSAMQVQVPDVREPSSPNGHGPNGRGDRNSQCALRTDHKADTWVNRGESGCPVVVNEDQADGSIADQSKHGGSGKEQSVPRCLSHHGWNGSHLLLSKTLASTCAGKTSRAFEAPASGRHSVQDQRVAWQLGGSNVEESAMLLDDSGKDSQGGASLQFSTTPQDQSPNTGTSFLADTLDNEEEGQPLNCWMPGTAAIPESASKRHSVAPELDLLAIDAVFKDKLPVPKMHKSLSSDSNALWSRPSAEKLFKSVSFQDEITPQCGSRSSKTRSTFHPEIASSSSKSSKTKTRSLSQASRTLDLVVKSTHAIGQEHNPGLPGSSTISMVPPAQLAFFQHQVKRVLKKMQRKAHREKKEMVLAKLVLLCAVTFAITWLPYVTVIVLDIARVSVAPMAKDLAIKVVFANAMLNPIFYGLCRRNYRRGYDYVSQLFCYKVTCGFIKRPGEDKVFYESKKRKMKRHLQAAKLDAQAQQLKHQRPSACALQILHHTLHLHSATLLPAMVAANSPQFVPSKKLQELFQQYMLESDSDSEATSTSIDYDALVFGEDANLYQSLRHVWSMCMSTDERGADLGTDDIELDVDYDALIDDDTMGQGNGHLCTPEMAADNGSVVGEHNADEATFLRMPTLVAQPESMEMQERSISKNQPEEE